MKMLATILLMLVTVAAYGQVFFIALSGIVTDNFTAMPLKDVVIRVEATSGPTFRAEHVTDPDGSYRFKLSKGSAYMVDYSKAGYVTKHIVIDATGVPAYPDVPYYDMDVQMVLFKRIPGFDFSFFDLPVGQAKYKQSVRTINWDNPWSEQRRRAMDLVMREYSKTYRGYYERNAKEPPVAIGDSMLVLNTDSLKDAVIVESIMAKFQPDTTTSYYNDPLAAPADQVEQVRGLFYTVQVGVYSSPTPLDRIYNITPLNSERMEDGHIRYTSGRFSDIAEANEHRKKMMAVGVQDAFVIAYFNGKRMPLEEAIYLSSKFGKAIIAE